MNDQIYFHHVREQDYFGELSAKGGVTLAWTRDIPNQRIVIAVALCHPKDTYVKKIGRDRAAERLQNALVKSTFAIRHDSPETTTVFDQDMLHGVIASVLIPNVYANESQLPATRVENLSNRRIFHILEQSGFLNNQNYTH
jgi:hypothetical protein